MDKTPEVSDFLELGLLFIVAGITGVLVGVIVMVMLFNGGGLRPVGLKLVLGALALLFGLLLVILLRRLYSFLGDRR